MCVSVGMGVGGSIGDGGYMNVPIWSLIHSFYLQQ